VDSKLTRSIKQLDSQSLSLRRQCEFQKNFGDNESQRIGAKCSLNENAIKDGVSQSRCIWPSQSTSAEFGETDLGDLGPEMSLLEAESPVVHVFKALPL